MGLTRITAQQISDIDYKQAVRVITLADVTLSGGAPSSVDGVNLSTNDRILVNGQSDGAENGLYYVVTVGAGSNGTWARTGDANQTGEIEAGMIVMVTEGTSYADTQWKLITNNPITVGTTPLEFEQSSAYSFGTITANAVGIVADTVGDTVTFTPGDNFVISGNATSDTITFGVSQSPTFTGNVSGGNISTVGELKSTGTFVIGSQKFYAQGNDGFSVNENFNAGNSTVTAYHYTSGAGRSAIVFDTAVTGQFTLGFGATGSAASNKFVLFAEYANTTWEWRKSVGISAPNLNGGTLLANINPDGNFWTAGTITGTGNITGGNLTTTGTGSIGTLSVSGTSALAGNVTVTGHVLPSANITYDLGSSTQRWNDIWLANSTIYLGSAQLSANATAVTITNPEGGTTVLSGATTDISAANVTVSDTVESGNVAIKDRGILYLYDTDSSNYIGHRAPGTLSGNFTYQWPTSYGNNTQVLTTNGAGGLTWEDAGEGGGSGASSYPNSTVQPVPGATGNFDLSYNFAQTVQETPFEAAGTDPFGVNLGEVYSMMDPVGEVLDPVDLGVLT